jgi:hypothetical protein
MKRVYIFQPDKLELEKEANQTFWMIDGFPVWDLGDGQYQIICEEGKLPVWAANGKDIRDCDKDPVLKASLGSGDNPKYQATCAAVAKDVGKGIEAKPARLTPLPRVVLLGMVPEDLVSDEPVDPKLGEGKP